MPNARPHRHARGFTLIELLVVMAIIGVLIVDLLPPLLSLRQAVAQNVGTQSLSAPLCQPPWCDSLAPGLALTYPAISQGVTDSAPLANGLKVRFDLAQAGAASPFAIFPGRAEGIQGAFDVLFGIEPRMLIGDDFDLHGVSVDDAGALRFEVAAVSDGSTLTLEAFGSGPTLTIGSVPEPPGWVLVVLALAGAAIALRRARRWALLVVTTAAAMSAQATVTGFTSRATFDAAVAALPGVHATVEGFDTTLAGTLISDGATLHGLRYGYGGSGNHLAGSGVGIEVVSGYGTTSAPNQLGTSDAGLFQSGDDFSLGFAAASAVGLYIISNDPLFDGDITLRAAGAAVSLKASAVQPFGLPDGRVYFLGLLDDAHSFSSAALASSCCALFVFNVDDIVLAGAVPEPSTAAFALLGIAGLSMFRRRRGALLVAAASLAASVAAPAAHAQRISLGDLQNQIAASATCPAALPGQPRFFDKGDGTVCDAATGLMWEKKVDCTGAPTGDNPHCLANTYTWSASAAGTDRSGTLYTDFLARLNDLVNLYDGNATPCFAGHCDWRIPTIGELRSLVSVPYPLCTTGLCVDPALGIPAQALVFWSSSEDARFGYYAWTVRFDLGYVVSYDSRSGGRSGIAVRGGR